MKVEINEKMRSILDQQKLDPKKLTITYTEFEAASPSNKRFVFKYRENWLNTIKIVRWYESKEEMLDWFSAISEEIKLKVNN